ncbi:hypothetical protein MRB53_039183 [Persea americana]|nr:hypothetical protein MRB53_039183 [Persea americana]
MVRSTVDRWRLGMILRPLSSIVSLLPPLSLFYLILVEFIENISSGQDLESTTDDHVYVLVSLNLRKLRSGNTAESAYVSLHFSSVNLKSLAIVTGVLLLILAYGVRACLGGYRTGSQESLIIRNEDALYSVEKST